MFFYTYHSLISSSLLMKFSNFFIPLTFCSRNKASVSQVLWIWDQPFHFIKYCSSSSSSSPSFSGTTFGSPVSLTLYTVVLCPVAGRKNRRKKVTTMYKELRKKKTLSNALEQHEPMTFYSTGKCINHLCPGRMTKTMRLIFVNITSSKFR